MNNEANLKELILLLQCPQCKEHESLELIQGAYDFKIPIELCTKFILCSSCNEHYPLKSDFIPIIWSTSLKRAFLKINLSESDLQSEANVSANMEIYDDISEDYDKYMRQDPVLSMRMRNAVKKIFLNKRLDNLMHLDYACGPGHVIEWLKPFGFKQVGLDVSLENLRNARQNTGCSVVCGMPFRNQAFDLVTEASALHHILDWKSALMESCRVCSKKGGVIIDSEPSEMQMAWGKLAVAFFNSRFRVYKILSYFIKSKYMFRDIERAKLNQIQAEIHHQPGTGFPLDLLEEIIESAGFDVTVIVSPNSELKTISNPSWQNIILNILSLRNPWNPDYGNFTAIATNPKNKGFE